MLLGIGVFSFMLGLALLLLAGIFITLDILWELVGFIFDIAIILIGIFGFILLI